MEKIGEKFSFFLNWTFVHSGGITLERLRFSGRAEGRKCNVIKADKKERELQERRLAVVELFRRKAEKLKEVEKWTIEKTEQVS